MLVLFSTCTWLHAGAKGPKARSNMGIRKVDRRETLEVETLEIHDDDLSFVPVSCRPVRDVEAAARDASRLGSLGSLETRAKTLQERGSTRINFCRVLVHRNGKQWTP
jgi:hypothetical protein